MLKAAQAYLSTQVTTTTQGDLLVMLYDAAIKFLKQAKIKIDERNYAEKGILISRALDIISELAQSLNKEKGGELAQNLNQIYFFCSTQLAKANLKMDTKMIDEVIGLLSTLRGAYAQILSGEAGGETTTPAPSPKTMGAVSSAASETPAAKSAAPEENSTPPQSTPSPTSPHTPPPPSPMGSPAAAPVASTPVFAPGYSASPGPQSTPSTSSYGPGVGYGLTQTHRKDDEDANGRASKPSALRLRARNAYTNSV